MVYPLSYSDLAKMTYTNSNFVLIENRWFLEANLTTKTNQNNGSSSIGNYDGNIDVVVFNWFKPNILNDNIDVMYLIDNNLLFKHADNRDTQFDYDGVYDICSNKVDPSIYNIFFSPLSFDLNTNLNISIKIINWVGYYQLRGLEKDGGNNEDGGGYHRNGNFRWIAIHKNIGDHFKINNIPIVYTNECQYLAKNYVNDIYNVDISNLHLTYNTYSVLLSPLDHYNSTYMYNLQIVEKKPNEFSVKYYMKNSTGGQNAAYGGDQPIMNITLDYIIRFQWAIFFQI